MSKSGDILNQTYQIVEKIGEGGNGIVFLAKHLRLQKKVVIKKVKNESAVKHNLRKEADILKNLHHQYLPQVYDFFDEGNDIYTVIDFIPGRDMEYYVERGMKFHEKQILTWLRQLAEALEYLHSQNPPIIHSDIKPSNIMIRPDGDICLIDFNVSMSEGSGNISGFSRRYASPEQVIRKKLMDENGNYQNIVIDERSDIYSLGISMYCLLTGKKPPIGKRAMKLPGDMQLAYSPWLLGMIDTMLQLNPAKRYSSAAAILNDLAKIKKKDKTYKSLLWVQRIISIAGICFLAVGIVVASAGIKEMNTEKFDKEYGELTEKYANSDFERVTSKGITVLNDKKYKVVMREEPAKKADILYIIANAYFEKEDYKNAVSFYEEAISFNNGNPEYYRDYAIALARNKDRQGAERILDEAISEGLEEDGVYLVKAEISLADGETEEAVKDLKKTIRLTQNGITKTRAYLLSARAYRQQNDYEKECRTLEECWEQEEDEFQENKVLRALGAAYTRYSESLSENQREEYLRKAISVYENIREKGNVTFTDYMNLAVLYQAIQEFDLCVEQLQEMQQLYPDDYRVYMRMALVLCEIENMRNLESRDYAQVKTYYDQAEQYYQKERNAGISDDNMQILEDTMTQLCDKGWIKE